MSERLYIVGNGFDIHHGISSSYSQFGQYLKEIDKHTFDYVERYFDVDADFWYEFEERLAYFDSDALVDNASVLLASPADENWSDDDNHAYSREIGWAVEAISKTMRARFGDWIRQLHIPERKCIEEPLKTIDLTAKFLNFNYTNSLQKLYGVQDQNILHIHGAASQKTSQLVLGHGWKPQNVEPYRHEDNLEDADTRVIEGIQIVDRYFVETFKPTHEIIQRYNLFFQERSQTTEICVLGHSLSEVDREYIFEIMKNIDVDKVRWKVSYYKNVEKTQDAIQLLGLDPSLVDYFKISEF